MSEEKTYFSVEIEDLPFCQTPDVNCHVFHQFGCRLDAVLWDAYRNILREKDPEWYDAYGIYTEDLPF